MGTDKHPIEFLVVDTSAFLRNAQLQNVGDKIITCQDVVDEILNKRQLRRLVVLPYDLDIKEVFPESIQFVTEFAKKTGDYPSLSATDIKVMALTYQLEKAHSGGAHLRSEPLMAKTLTSDNKSVSDTTADDTNFFQADKLSESLASLNCDSDAEEASEDDDDDDSGWITPGNVQKVKQQHNAKLSEEKHVQVACMTSDFAMQNVLKQMNLNVAALDGRVIKQLRTFILRCYTCFKTTSIMTKTFCPKCGHNTLKKVAVSVDDDGNLQIHINTRRPLTARGKKFSLPKMKGGKHPNNPVLVDDHPLPQNHVSKLAKTKVNALDEDYIAGFSPFAVRDVTSRSAMLGIRPGDVKHWMQKNPNEARRRRK